MTKYKIFMEVSGADLKLYDISAAELLDLEAELKQEHISYDIFRIDFHSGSKDIEDNFEAARSLNREYKKLIKC